MILKFFIYFLFFHDFLIVSCKIFDMSHNCSKSFNHIVIIHFRSCVFLAKGRLTQSENFS